MNIVIRKNFFFLLFLFLPVSIILGSTVSLINIIILNLSFLIFLIYQRKFQFIQHISIKLMLILYIYLIFNSLISLNYEVGLSRNIGFIRLIILFVFINYFFFYHKNEKKIFDAWSLILSILIIDVFIEYIFGKNLIGWGDYSQLYGDRVTSFCYPYGSIETINDKSIKVASEIYESASTLIRGRIKNKNIHYLPRIDLYKENPISLVRLKTLMSK